MTSEVTLAASPIIKGVYRAYMARFGDPDDSIVYEDDGAEHGRPGRIDVFVWRASAPGAITAFSTIGMAACPMQGAGHRAELRFVVRSDMGPAAIGETSQFLANLAIHPFLTATVFDWWHKVRDPGRIPLFTAATSVIFHPKFVADGGDTIEIDGETVKILNVVPITPQEYRIGPVPDLIDHWRESGVDLFAPR